MKTNRNSGAARTKAAPSVRTREQLKALAWLLDSSIRLPGGFRIGVDALLGLVPFIGDAAGVLLSGFIVSRAARLGVPRSVLLRMMLNVAIEAVVGLVPIAGDIFDAAWKANQRNVALLESHLNAPQETARTSRRLVGVVLLLLVLLLVVMSALSALIVGWVISALGG
ncbi:DUF4112 domain-containing protein [Aromatoleum sp.]|uniref:DUF4112 domain-containing protein n=1 Tax=Aromatoleum sp. TaxID=2307007 RepID=UPI002FC6723A